MAARRKEYSKKVKDYEKSGDKEQSKICDIRQYAYKILANSFYGGLGTPFFQFYSLDNAMSITLTGQYVIKSISNNVNKYMNNLMQTVDIDYIIFNDTDSLGLHLDTYVNKFIGKDKPKAEVIQKLDDFCKDYISPEIARIIEETVQYLNCYKNSIVMNREAICDKAIWTAKKRYVLNILDKEGKKLEQPELKIKGIQVVSSGTPDVCRAALNESLKIIMGKSNGDLVEFIEDFREKFNKFTPDQIAFPKSVSGLEKYIDSTKSVPIQVRASLNFNKLVQSLNLAKIYQFIKSGQKIKYVYLKMPNIIFNDVIGFSGKLPKEFKLHDYVDYNLQFEKAFLEPLKAITDVNKWDTEERNSLFG